MDAAVSDRGAGVPCGAVGAAVEDLPGHSPARPAPARSRPASGSVRPAVPTWGRSRRRLRAQPGRHPRSPPRREPAVECGGDVAMDGYCTNCGAGAESLRDHFTEQPAAWVAAVCDRGVRHTRNEDAVALDAGAEPGSHAVLVVL